ncbi:hypothetical protein [Bythopirellula polymerisocia]|uniref:hypothetical protein n=1 Tax=Bythopirellula polymerisocia TaxID=2528003 RepID=UPI0011B5F342|nr:hypothetical protein [Bythopirellula polymerisocia]
MSSCSAPTVSPPTPRRFAPTGGSQAQAEGDRQHFDCCPPAANWESAISDGKNSTPDARVQANFPGIAGQIDGSPERDEAAQKNCPGAFKVERLASWFFVGIPPMPRHLVGECFHLETRERRVSGGVHLMSDESSAVAMAHMTRETGRSTKGRIFQGIESERKLFVG